MDVQTLDNRTDRLTKTARPRKRRPDVARKSSRSRRWLAVFLPCSLLACGSLNVADFAAFLVPAVTVIIENDTSFTAIPVLSASDSRNGIEDVFATDDPLTHFGTNGAIAPHQTVTFRLPCESDLETLAFEGAEFREANGFQLGDANVDVTLRRDRDFDCGDVVRIRLVGTIFNFHADLDVERAPTDDPEQDRQDEIDDIADIAGFLEDLFD